MDITSISITSVQTVQPSHHHHRKSMADRISQMETGVDDALKAGQLTDDQAKQMQSVLDSITATLQQNTSSGTQLSSDDLKNIRTQMQDIGKQLYAATHPGDAAQATGNSDAKNMFAAILEALQNAMQNNGVQGAHKHHSMADRISKMQSDIDDAVKAGQLTQDQADQMNKQLSSISDELKTAQANSGTLSEDDRKKIGQELHDIGQQLYAATNPSDGTQQLSNTSGADGSSFAALLKALQNTGNTDGSSSGNGSNDTFAANTNSSMFDDLIKQMQSGTQYNQQGGVTINASVTQSLFSIIA
jgi:polyhydroxyalkanoate synthesis regulator phasin